MAAKEKKVKKTAAVPSYHGRFPFAPEEKRPILLTEEMRVPRLYGKGQNLIATYTCASTDRIHVSTFTVLPGRHFDPPDIHVGDEVYYVTEGQASLFNPETGQILSAAKGDFIYIPAGAWHQVWNFGSELVTFINWIAPAMWSEKDRGTSIEFDGTPAYYKAQPEGL